MCIQMDRIGGEMVVACYNMFAWRYTGKTLVFECRCKPSASRMQDGPHCIRSARLHDVNVYKFTNLYDVGLYQANSDDKNNYNDNNNNDRQRTTQLHGAGSSFIGQ